MTTAPLLSYFNYERELNSRIKEPHVKSACKTGYITALYEAKLIDKEQLNTLSKLILNEMIGSNI